MPGVLASRIGGSEHQAAAGVNVKGSQRANARANDIEARKARA